MPITIADITIAAKTIIPTAQELYNKVQAYQKNCKEMKDLADRIQKITISIFAITNSGLPNSKELEELEDQSIKSLQTRLAKAIKLIEECEAQWKVTGFVFSTKIRKSINLVNRRLGQSQEDFILDVKPVDMSEVKLHRVEKDTLTGDEKNKFEGGSSPGSDSVKYTGEGEDEKYLPPKSPSIGNSLSSVSALLPSGFQSQILAATAALIKEKEKLVKEIQEADEKMKKGLSGEIKTAQSKAKMKTGFIVLGAMVGAGIAAPLTGGMSIPAAIAITTASTAGGALIGLGIESIRVKAIEIAEMSEEKLHQYASEHPFAFHMFCFCSAITITGLAIVKLLEYSTLIVTKPIEYIGVLLQRCGLYQGSIPQQVVAFIEDVYNYTKEALEDFSKGKEKLTKIFNVPQAPLSVKVVVSLYEQALNLANIDKAIGDILGKNKDSEFSSSSSRFQYSSSASTSSSSSSSSSSTFKTNQG